MRNCWLRLGLVLASTALVAGCYGARKGAEQAGLVAEDARRLQRIPVNSAPEIAEQIMGRKPSAVNQDGDLVIHYYVVRGAVDGETLRLVYRNNRLIAQNIENAQSMR